MSLLMDALRRAEEDKRRAAERAAAEGEARNAVPGVTEATAQPTGSATLPAAPAGGGGGTFGTGAQPTGSATPPAAPADGDGGTFGTGAQPTGSATPPAAPGPAGSVPAYSGAGTEELALEPIPPAADAATGAGPAAHPHALDALDALDEDLDRPDASAPGSSTIERALAALGLPESGGGQRDPEATRESVKTRESAGEATLPSERALRSSLREFFDASQPVDADGSVEGTSPTVHHEGDTGPNRLAPEVPETAPQAVDHRTGRSERVSAQAVLAAAHRRSSSPVFTLLVVSLFLVATTLGAVGFYYYAQTLSAPTLPMPARAVAERESLTTPEALRRPVRVPQETAPAAAAPSAELRSAPGHDGHASGDAAVGAATAPDATGTASAPADVAGRAPAPPGRARDADGDRAAAPGTRVDGGESAETVTQLEAPAADDAGTERSVRGASAVAVATAGDAASSGAAPAPKAGALAVTPAPATASAVAADAPATAAAVAADAPATASAAAADAPATASAAAADAPATAAVAAQAPLAGASAAPTRATPAEAPLLMGPEGAPPIAAAVRISRSAREPTIAPGLMEAYAAWRRGDLAAADRGYRSVLAARPGLRDALLGLAGVAVARGQPREAARLYREVLERDPRDTIASAGLMSLQGGGASAGDVADLQLMLDEEPAAAHLHFALGNHHARAQRWREAQAAYFEAWRLEVDNADYAFNLAVALDQLGQGQAATEYYRRALSNAARGRLAPVFDRAAVEARLRSLHAAATP